MSDTLTEGTGAEGAVTDAGTDAGAAGAADAGAAEDRSAPPTWEYVENLRKESASYRTRAKDAETRAQEYDDVFGKVDPEDRKVWLGMAKTMYEDPKAGAEWLAKVAEHVQSGLTQEQAETAADAELGSPDEKPLTQADFDRMYQERRGQETAAAQREADIKAINDEAAALGYKDGTVEYDLLLGIALKQTNGDFKAAHQVIVDSKQAVIDDYVAGKAADGGAARAPDGGVPVASGGAKPIKTMKDADAAAKARMAALGEAGAPINTARRGRRG